MQKMMYFREEEGSLSALLDQKHHKKFLCIYFYCFFCRVLLNPSSVHVNFPSYSRVKIRLVNWYLTSTTWRIKRNHLVQTNFKCLNYKATSTSLKKTIFHQKMNQIFSVVYEVGMETRSLQ